MSLTRENKLADNTPVLVRKSSLINSKEKIISSVYENIITRISTDAQLSNLLISTYFE